MVNDNAQRATKTLFRQGRIRPPTEDALLGDDGAAHSAEEILLGANASAPPRSDISSEIPRNGPLGRTLGVLKKIFQ